jgi:hypothetical protein
MAKKNLDLVEKEDKELAEYIVNGLKGKINLNERIFKFI